MVNFCCVFGCSNRSNRDKTSFFSIPTVICHQGDQTRNISEKRRQKWLSNINRKGWTPTKYSKVCAKHFHTGKPSDLYCEENPDWAPTLNLGHDKAKKTATVSSVDRFERAKRRSNKKPPASIPQKKQRLHPMRLPFEEISVSNAENIENVGRTCENGTQTDLTGTMIDNMKDQLHMYVKETQDLKADLQSRSLDENYIKDNNEKTKYYTGLPYFSVLMTLFGLLKDHLPDMKLSKFQQVFLVLMRLRLNLPLQDLAYRFNVSKSTASRTFLTVIDIMNTRMNFLLKWPSREQLHKTMLLSFREHFGKKVAVIIDCFEVFIERPSNLMARSQTWSSYKHHNTVKFLIGITPQGVISFISKAWGGRVSDKYITEHSGFLDKLLPGDLVLADRGFNVAESVGLQHAHLNIPAFTKGKKQLSALDIESTRKIAHVRIHVERVIGSVRQKYTMLQGTIPVAFMFQTDKNGLTSVDKIASVCCALTNLSDSVVPRE